MPDRGKVIKGLEEVDAYFHRMTEVCYRGDEATFCDLKEKVADAIVLLKEQEAVEPYMDYDGHDVWRCGNCGATIFHIEHSQADEDWKSYAKFCRQCGKKVKWDD